MICLTCPTCSAKLQVADTAAETKIFCQKCGQKLLVPSIPRPTPQNKTVIGKIERVLPNRPKLARIRPASTGSKLPRWALVAGLAGVALILALGIGLVVVMLNWPEPPGPVADLPGPDKTEKPASVPKTESEPKKETPGPGEVKIEPKKTEPKKEEKPEPEKPTKPVDPKPMDPPSKPPEMKEPPPPPPMPKKFSYERGTQEYKALEITNKLRKENGDLPALEPNESLTKAAQAHAVNMARQDILAHVLDGKNPLDRAKEFGYSGTYVGENAGAPSAKEQEPLIVAASTGWWNSKPHKANILNSKFVHNGFGMAKSASGKWYCCQVFGTP